MDPQRHTITGLLETLGRESVDWSRAYRLYHDHLDQAALFGSILDGVLELLAADQPVVVAVDDTYFTKTGKKMAATGWYRDPLGPPFHTNLTRAQRFLILSVGIPDPAHPKRAWMVPVSVCLIPKLPKPGKKATPEECDHYEQLKALNSPGVHAARLIRVLRQHIDKDPQQRNRMIVLCGDGDYTNSSLLSCLPERTVYIGRSRDDLCLFEPARPAEGPKVGRPASYGKALPKPAEVRRDKTRPWQSTTIGKTTAYYKRIAPAKWSKAGEKTLVQVIVVKPLRYQTHKKGPWKYTQPACLVCTDPQMAIERLLQYYFWRWGIEVNNKEIKQLLGAGQAQVRTLPSVESAPATCIASYSALLLAGLRVYGTHDKPASCQTPKWYRNKKQRRMTSSDLLRQFHLEIMRAGTGNLSPLASSFLKTRTPRNSENRLEVDPHRHAA